MIIIYYILQLSRVRVMVYITTNCILNYYYILLWM
nr:MAG TPA_asm: hypothetical protein [Caudoviricetes sp.]